LKNYGVLYSSPADVRLAPLFDVVTTSIYRYARYSGGPELEDKTLALKLFAGKHGSKVYPSTAELLRFGRECCGVTQPQAVLDRIAHGMRQALHNAKIDRRIPAELLASMELAWQWGLAHAVKTPG
jgi:serine/threonine-protein kinase HipA